MPRVGNRFPTSGSTLDKNRAKLPQIKNRAKLPQIVANSFNAWSCCEKAWEGSEMVEAPNALEWAALKDSKCVLEEDAGACPFGARQVQEMRFTEHKMGLAERRGGRSEN